MTLTAKQEAFAQAVASGKSQADAYRAAYDASRSKPESVHSRASSLMADVKVASRVAELRAPAAQAAQVTLEGHLTRLETLSKAAETAGQYSAAIAAEIARGKHSGIVVDKLEHSGSIGLAPLTIKINSK